MKIYKGFLPFYAIAFKIQTKKTIFCKKGNKAPYPKLVCG